MRRNLFEILKEKNFDLKREYSRLYSLFYEPTGIGLLDDSICNTVDENFLIMNSILTRRCTSLDDFDHTYGFKWEENPEQIDLDYFLTFCEYVYNFALELHEMNIRRVHNRLERIIGNVIECMDMLGYAEIICEDIISIFVEKKPEILAVAEIIEPKLGFKVMEYNHHKMKGNLNDKRIILKMMADDIETHRGKLNSINKTLTSDLFQMMNKFVRHDNSQNAYIQSMSNDELENTYDDIYQMWLLSKLELDNLERKERVKILLQKVNAR